jgi:PAS domain S-box-containing protein
LQLLFKQLLFSLLLVSSVFSADPQPLRKEVTIGVLTIRPKPEIMKMYQPLADELSKNIPTHHFNILPLQYEETKPAIAAGQINFMITNVGHFVAIEAEYPIANLATLVQKTKDGRPVANLGGVIVVRADRTDITELSDLKGKKIVAVSPNAIVAYLAQAKLLYDNDIDIKKSATITFKDKPQDELVVDVKEGRQDVAFIRASTLERMAADKKINISEFRVINTRQEKGFPYLLSTPLYPQWLCASVKNITDADKELSKKVAITLLSIKDTDIAASTGGYYGWDVPVSTESTKQMCQALKVPPFDIERKITVSDVFGKYLWEILAFLFGLALTVFFAIRYQMLARKVEEERAHLELVSETMTEGMYVIDKDGKIVIINNAALVELGYVKNEMMGEVAHYTFHAHSKNAHMPMNQCPIYRTIVEDGQYQGEEYFRRKDGTMFLSEVSSKALLEKGEIVGTVTVFKDITRRKENEQLLKQLNETLEQKVAEESAKLVEKEKILIQQSKMAMMGEMIGAIAHQWRQPLNSLGMTVQDVEMAYKFGELDENYIVTFKKDAMAIIQSMSVTIEDFRNFFSPNKKLEEFFIEDAIKDALKILTAQMKLNSISVTFDDSPQDKHGFLCYKNELKQVLLNVLANAKDALIEVKPKDAFIKIDISKEGKAYKISIEDSAGGIAEENLDKIFDSHFTTKGADKGTGIGLYMSKEIVEGHLGGKLSVENTEFGARFIIELPHS